MLRRYVVELGGPGNEYEVAVEALGNHRYAVTRAGKTVEWDARRIGGTWSLVPAGGGKKHEVELDNKSGALSVTSGSLVGIPGRIVDPLQRAAEQAAAARPAGPADVKSPMPGKVVRALVAIGATVSAGQAVMVVEAMKMENELKAPRDGTVKEIRATDGQAIEAGQTLLVLT